MTHRRVLVSATVVLAAFVLWLGVVELLDAGPTARGQTSPSDELPPSETPYLLDFADTEIQQKWAPQPPSGSWRFSGATYMQERSDARNASSVYDGTVASDYRFTVDVRRSSTSGNYGIVFNVDPGSNQPAYVVRFNDVDNLLEWGHFDEDGEFVQQGVHLEPSGKPTQYRTIAVDVEGDAYSVLLIDKTDDEIDFESEQVGFTRLAPSHFGLHTDDASAIFQNAKVYVGPRSTPTPSPAATDTPPVTPTETEAPTTAATATTVPTATPTNTGTPDPLLEPNGNAYDLRLNDANVINSDWYKQSGNWATDSDGGGYRYDDINRSNAATYYRKRPNGDYELTVNLKMEERNASSFAGVVFNAPRRSELNDTYIVRFNGDRQLEWGLFRDGAFQKTSEKVLDDSILQKGSSDEHRIRVIVASDHYTVKFNDSDIDNANDVRFEADHVRVPQPYFGLYGSQTKTLFPLVSVKVNARTTPTVIPTPSPTPSPLATPNCEDNTVLQGTYELLTTDNWHPLSDGWPDSPVDNSMRHSRTDAATAVTYYGGCVDADYSIDVNLQINAAGEMPWGAGVVFNAPNRSGSVGAYVVRFDGDHLLEWGPIVDGDRFQPSGDSVLSEESVSPGEHRLAVRVTSDRYWIRFDGVEVSETAEGVPFNDAGSGRVRQPYVGLYASNADATYRSLLLDVGEQYQGATPTPTLSPTPTSTWTPTATNTRKPTSQSTSTPTTTRTPTHTSTVTPTSTGTATPFATSPLVTPTPSAVFASPTPNVPPTAVPPTPNIAASSTAAALATQQAVAAVPPTPTLTWTPAPMAESPLSMPSPPTPTAIPTATEVVIAVVAVKPSMQGAVVVTATFTPTQRPIETPTPTSTPDTLLFYANVVDSAIAAAGWIWFAAGSLVFFIVAGILAGLGFRQQERNRYELLAPVEPDPTPDGDPFFDQGLVPPADIADPDHSDEPPGDWPPSLP